MQVSKVSMPVCTFRHILKLADEKPELNLLPALSLFVHRSFKNVVLHVIWTYLGECRKRWFPTVEEFHEQSTSNEFKVLINTGLMVCLDMVEIFLLQE